MQNSMPLFISGRWTDAKASDTNRPVACITLYPYYRDFGIIDDGVRYGGTPDEYRQALRDVVAGSSHPNLHLIEGPELLTNIGGLTADLLHPSDNAMIEMGRNLARCLKDLLKKNGRET